MNIRRFLFAGAATVAIGLPMFAQAPASTDKPSFDVASVKLNKSGDGGVAIRNQPGGRFTATNAPLRLLIRIAYKIQDFQVVGAPDWSDRFDIVAKAASD